MRIEALVSSLLNEDNARIHVDCSNIVNPMGGLGAVLRPTIKRRVLDLDGVDQVLGKSDRGCIGCGDAPSPRLRVGGLKVLYDVNAAGRHLREKHGKADLRMINLVGPIVDHDVWRATQYPYNSHEVGFVRLITLDDRHSRAEVNVLLVQVESDNL